MRTKLIQIAFALALTTATFAAAQPEPRVAVTRHVGHFNGQTVNYTATVAESFLHDANGAPTASVVTIAYVRDGVADQAKRPVLFCFNGGPGASSSPTHTQALGPMIRADSIAADRNAGAGFHENACCSPLDIVDLVFIDPVGTGFSRPLPGIDAKPYYSVTGDALEVKGLITDWLKAHHREASPRYMLGESYGTNRAAAIVKNGQDLPFDGVLLVALAANVGTRDALRFVPADHGGWRLVSPEDRPQGPLGGAGVRRGADLRAHQLCHRADHAAVRRRRRSIDRCADVVADRLVCRLHRGATTCASRRTTTCSIC